MQVQSLGQEDSLEEVTATHSSIPAWRILCTEEPDELWPTGYQRVGRDWSNLAHTHIFTLSIGSARRAHRGGVPLCPPQAFLLRPEQKILRKEGGWRKKGKERRKGGKESKKKTVSRHSSSMGIKPFAVAHQQSWVGPVGIRWRKTGSALHVDAGLPDSWVKYLRKTFSDPRFSHLFLQRKAQ